MTQDDEKAAAWAAPDYVSDTIVGVGTGSTVITLLMHWRR